ncbi:LOW QUALITY PROTEIN: Ataxin-7 [Frankliniella fusca]|uniref:Ataxin-7 n=1 Tax=Frankliniella fusca TaxID=407009 RepID=A0AAE1LB25_9NEOP|nr:LOW QUALITY PROTEIN: Ataxin-7 [Frankliniella fusca]
MFESFSAVAVWGNRLTWRQVGRAWPIFSDFLGLLGQNTRKIYLIQVRLNTKLLVIRIQSFRDVLFAEKMPFTVTLAHVPFDGDEEEKNGGRRKSSDAMRLYSSDMQKFGLFPETDCFCTVVCSECNALVKPQGLLNHMRLRHKELVPERISPEKLHKLSDTSIKSVGDKISAKHVLNEKLMTKLILNEKHSNKTTNEKLPNSPSDKSKSSEKLSSKYTSSEKTSQKTGEKFLGKSTGDKPSRTINDKVKVPPEKSVAGASLLIDKTLVKNDTEKILKAVPELNSMQADIASSKKFGDNKPCKSISNDRLYASPENKAAMGDRLLSKTGEKISVKSVLSEKLLSKVAASEKAAAMQERVKSVDQALSDLSSKKGDSVLKPDLRMAAKPVMKSLLKRSNEVMQNIVPGTSLLRPLIHQDREAVPASPIIGNTTLSPPILTPENITPERHQSATDMPVLSRKRKYRERKAAPTQYDPDRHCGVWCDYFNKFCVRSLTCKVHSVALRRAVVGRSKPFDQLLTEHKRAKEDQRQSREDQDNFSELSPQISERLHSPSEPSNSSFVSSPCASPGSSLATSPSENVFLSNTQDEIVTLCTPSTSTSPPVPLPSYQYPPYPPPDSSFSSAPESMVTLSPHLSSPLLNVALPSLSPSHAPRPPDNSEEDPSKAPRNNARAINRLNLNKGKQFNVKHSAFPPKPLRTCLFQGRKSSGMFFIQRELESMRAGFRLSLVKGAKSTPMGHVTSANQSLLDSSSSHSSTSILIDPTHQSAGINTSSPSNLKSAFSNLSSPKSVLNREIQQKVQRNQRLGNNGAEVAPQVMSPDGSLTTGTEKMPQGMRISVPTTIPQQIAYLTTSSPVTFQQVPLINSQVLSQLQLQKGGGGTLKLLSTGGSGRTLFVHQYQDGSGAES